MDMALSAGFLSTIIELSQQNSVTSCLLTKEQWNTFSFRGICSYNKNSSQRKTLCLVALVITLLCIDQLYETDSKIREQATKLILLIISPCLLIIPLSFLPRFLPPPSFLPSLFPSSSLPLSLFLSTPLFTPPLDARQSLYSLSCTSSPGLFSFISFIDTAV